MKYGYCCLIVSAQQKHLLWTLLKQNTQQWFSEVCNWQWSEVVVNWRCYCARRTSKRRKVSNWARLIRVLVLSTREKIICWCRCKNIDHTPVPRLLCSFVGVTPSWRTTFMWKSRSDQQIVHCFHWLPVGITLTWILWWAPLKSQIDVT